MQLIKNLIFILILIISIVFIIDLMEKNNDDFIQKTYLKTAIAKKENPDEYDKAFLKNNKAVDQVMIKLPFSESNGGELKVWGKLTQHSKAHENNGLHRSSHRRG